MFTTSCQIEYLRSRRIKVYLCVLEPYKKKTATSRNRTASTSVRIHNAIEVNFAKCTMLLDRKLILLIINVDQCCFLSDLRNTYGIARRSADD